METSGSSIRGLTILPGPPSSERGPDEGCATGGCSSCRPRSSPAGDDGPMVRTRQNRLKLRKLLKRDGGSLNAIERAFRTAMVRDTGAMAAHLDDLLLRDHRKRHQRCLIIKPVGDGCNYRCDYCFHHDVLEKLDRMSLGAVEEIYRTAHAALGENVEFTWHGGEPTLAGLPFFERAMELQIAVFGKLVDNTIQTNGSQMSPAWVNFFRAHRFSVGISIDGSREAHDRHRRNAAGKGTFDRTLRAMECLRDAGYPFGVIAVFTPGDSDPAALYDLVTKAGATRMSTNPAAVATERGLSPLAEAYGAFVVGLIRRWMERGGAGTFLAEVADFLGGLIGGWQPTCYVNGSCSHFLTIQKDGWVKACCDRNTDFNAHPETYLGNIQATGLSEILNGPAIAHFAAQADVNPVSCSGCEWLDMCRGGCSHQRMVEGGHLAAHDPFCKSYKIIFAFLQSAIDSIPDS